MPRILVVDDSKFMRMALKNILQKIGSEVVGEAEKDTEAVEKYKELKPDLVTMDIIMPIESGLNAVRNICEFDPDAKIVMVSAMGQESIIEEAMQLGAKGFVIKPVNPEKLIDTINRVLE